jgi:hypothetical protein
MQILTVIVICLKKDRKGTALKNEDVIKLVSEANRIAQSRTISNNQLDWLARYGAMGEESADSMPFRVISVLCAELKRERDDTNPPSVSGLPDQFNPLVMNAEVGDEKPLSIDRSQIVRDIREFAT